ncbi:MAG: pyridoxamine 5'-phosphate oxidase family protein [Geodermatophilaceae bacterium]|nr:pyridoxamine 5'-phosphate oxidase family protein [Geodermatophilaceae bacterium]
MRAHSTEPVGDRPVFPDGYGIPITSEGLLAWAQVEERLIAAAHYWLATVRPDGTPHAVPRWGVWLEGRFFYDGAPTTRHARNLAVNPACSLNLESGTQTVIVEGRSEPIRAPADGLGAQLSTAFEKYHGLGYAPGPESWVDGGGLMVLTPKRALAWFDFPKDCTRFRFTD